MFLIIIIRAQKNSYLHPLTLFVWIVLLWGVKRDTKMFTLWNHIYDTMYQFHHFHLASDQ